MSRYIQPQGKRGSLKWIQLAVNSRPDVLDRAILPRLERAASISWLSPRADDEFSEYRDSAFLRQIRLPQLAGALADFWPRLGPQWDALARSDADDVLLIEAKAHINELNSPATAASPVSRAKIEASFAAVIAAVGARPKSPWTEAYYQLANRFAHLHFLREHGVSAWLVLVNFVGDADMKGPVSEGEWETAYCTALDILGVQEGSPLLRNVLHVHLNVAELA